VKKGHAGDGKIGKRDRKGKAVHEKFGHDQRWRRKPFLGGQLKEKGKKKNSRSFGGFCEGKREEKQGASGNNLKTRRSERTLGGARWLRELVNDFTSTVSKKNEEGGRTSRGCIHKEVKTLNNLLKSKAWGQPKRKVCERKYTCSL